MAKNRTTTQLLSAPHRLVRIIFFITFVSSRFHPFSPPVLRLMNPDQPKFDTEEKKITIFTRKNSSRSTDGQLLSPGQTKLTSRRFVFPLVDSELPIKFSYVMVAVVRRSKPQSRRFNTIKHANSHDNSVCVAFGCYPRGIGAEKCTRFVYNSTCPRAPCHRKRGLAQNKGLDGL